MYRKTRLLFVPGLIVTAWMPLAGVLSHSLEVPPPVAVVIGLTMLATAVTVLAGIWLVQTLAAEKPKRKRDRARPMNLLSDGELADAGLRPIEKSSPPRYTSYPN